MSNSTITRDEINQITRQLIELGLSDDQNFAVLKEVHADCFEVTYDSDTGISYALKNHPYPEIYAEIKTNRDYNISLPDGGLIQLQYRFDQDEVIKHRLGFFPSPDLSEFQNDPAIYEEDLVYADVISSYVMTTPLRFDFDAAAFVEGEHPKSHVTIGQYQNCRIPVRSALGPSKFVEFILASFYNTAFQSYSDQIIKSGLLHPETITPVEAKRVHFSMECR